MMLRDFSDEKNVYLLLDNPGGESYSPDTFFSGTRLTGVQVVPVKYVKFADDQNRLRQQLKHAGISSGALIIVPIERFCNKGKCMVSYDNGIPIYKDRSHLRSSYVKEYVKYLDDVIMK